MLLLAVALLAAVTAGIVVSSGPSANAATTILVGDVGATPDGAFPYTCGDVLNPCDTIQHGIDTAAPGDIVDIASGTWNENVVLNKRLTLQGAGSGPSDTVITSAATSTPVITIDGNLATGLSSSDRVVIQDVRVTGATGGSGNANSGIRVSGSGTTQFLTFNSVAVVGNSGNGIAFDHTGTVADVEVTNSDLSNNGNAGFRIPTSIASFTGLTVSGSTFTDNAINGIQTGGSGSPNVDDITIIDTAFDGNGTATSGGDGDISLFKYNGDALIKDVTIDADSHIGLQLRGSDTLAPAGNVNLDNVQITGSPRFGFSLIGFSSTAGLSFTDVSVATTGNYSLYVENITSALDIGNTTLGGGNLVASLANVSAAPIDATGATFTGAADNFAIEDRVLHGIDAAGGGIVTWVPNNVYVTVNSFVPPLSLSASIQRGVDGVAVGGTVNVGPGTFANNVNVNKTVEIAGSGQGTTIVVPAVSNPVCGPGSVCGGASSDVFRIAKSDVEIHDLTVDGDNTALGGGFAQNGADVNARNGIIEYFPSGVFNNTSIHDVTVQNIYLRGIYVASGGSNFSVADNTVTNGTGEAASIAIFNFGGSGSMTGNTVDAANDAISSNWSRGTVYQDNTVTNSSSGVHTDNNGGSGGVADVIENNSVSDCAVNGYGVWTFAPYLSPTVKNNTVTNCAVGLTAAGSFAASATTTFTDNVVDGQGLANSTGVYVTTSLFIFGSANVQTIFTGNIITNTQDGFYVEAEPGFTASVTANFNEISGNSNSAAQSGGTGTFDVDLTANWWGSTAGPSHPQNPTGTDNAVIGTDLPFSPWLGFGDASGADGFQAASPMTWYVSTGVCGTTCIQAAIDWSANGDTVKVKSGVFPEHVTVNKQIVLTQGSAPIIDGGGSGDVVTITAPNVTLDGFEIRNGTNGVVVTSANNATVKNNNIHDFTSAALRATSSSGASISTNVIDGPHTGSCVGGFWGIIVTDVSGSIATNDISGIGNGLTTGCQEGRAVEAKGTGTVAIADNVIDTYQKSGIIIRDAVNSNITGNTTTGEGPTSAIAMNGITTVSSGTTSISGNHTSGHAYLPTSDISCGILVIGTATVSGNDSDKDEVGICALGGTGTQVTGNGVDRHRQQGILADGATNILVDGNDIDGQGSGTTASAGTGPDTDTRYYGIFVVDSTGDISNNVIKGITHGVANGTQSGVGIRAAARPGGTTDIDVTGNTISGYQKNGMAIGNFYGGVSVNADIDGNTVTGAGPVNYIAQNGIQLSSGATGTITNNNVSGNDYTPFSAAAVGLLVVGANNVTVDGNQVHDNMEGMYVQQANNAVVTDNTFTNNYDASIFTYLSSNGTYTGNQVFGEAGSFGMYFYDASTGNSVTGNAFRDHDYGLLLDYTGPSAPTSNVFNNNCIAGNTVAGMHLEGTVSGGPVNAENNWWGRTNGPTPPGNGDVISPPADIDATPFLTAPVAGCPVPADGDGDGVDDVTDNCDFVYNPGQENNDGEPMLLPKPVPTYNDVTNPAADALGDACDNDIDGDGIANGTETSLFLSPYVWDTDGDRTNDGTEVACGSDPLSAVSNLTGTDTDHDGLPDACETVYGSNANDSDSDNDGVLDGIEVRYWMSSAISVNTDADDCTDGREMASVNGDRKVSSIDLSQLAQYFGQLPPSFRPFDVNGDGQVSSIDLSLTAQRFGDCTPS
jgi:parallel beta-helix repeat protein